MKALERIIVIPRNASDDPAPAGIDDMQGLDDLLDKLGGNEPAPGGDPAPDTDPEPDPKTDPDPDPNPDPDPGQQQDPGSQNQIAHKAFAQLRAENATFKRSLMAFAKANNIEFSDESDLLQKIEAIDLKARAEKQGIPEDVLRRIEMLEQQNSLYSQDQLKTQALVGFQKVKDTFSLPPETLQKFADELMEQGINPFEMPVDVVKEFKASAHYDAIVKKQQEDAVQAAVEAALKRQNGANEGGSNPTTKRGKGTHAGQEVQTMGDLNALLDGLK